jgi:DNA polymerase-3 subunit epsilon
VGFDLKLLRKEMDATGHKLNNPAVDTARVHQWLLRHGRYSEDLHIQLEKLDLATLAKHYGLELHDAHHALDDAFLTARVWQVMMRKAQAQGIRNLGELLKIAGA